MDTLQSFIVFVTRWTHYRVSLSWSQGGHTTEFHCLRHKVDTLQSFIVFVTKWTHYRVSLSWSQGGHTTEFHCLRHKVDTLQSFIVLVARWTHYRVSLSWSQGGHTTEFHYANVHCHMPTTLANHHARRMTAQLVVTCSVAMPEYPIGRINTIYPKNDTYYNNRNLFWSPDSVYRTSP